MIIFNSSCATAALPEGTLNQPYRSDTRSLILDGTSEMDIKDFAAAIPDKMFDYIVFEACLMAGVEVAYELKEKTNYIMASAAEILSPGFTGIYPALLTSLTSEKETKAALIEAADLYFNHMNSKVGVERSATISILKTSALPELAAQVKLLQPYSRGADISRIQHFDRNGNLYHLFFDLEDYLTQTTGVSLSELIGQIVVYQRSTPSFLPVYSGFNIEKHCGLTTYIPQSRFGYLNREYGKLKWYREIE